MYKCIQYAFSASHAKENLRVVGRVVAGKGYLKSWWLGAAKMAPLSLRACAWAIEETHGLISCLLATMVAPWSRSS